MVAILSKPRKHRAAEVIRRFPQGHTDCDEEPKARGPSPVRVSQYVQEIHPFYSVSEALYCGADDLSSQMWSEVKDIGRD
ncbi:hypothetical protein CA601_13815 [Paraburkholderia hospita]|nr:hypothetical protein CA601_13815 [Paraburkholderia hospita]